MSCATSVAQAIAPLLAELAGIGSVSYPKRKVRRWGPTDLHWVYRSLGGWGRDRETGTGPLSAQSRGGL